MSMPARMTPMLRQYLEIKESYQQEILFYRMGDFYEMFFEDAEIASKILNITLTSRNNKADTAKVPMCGVPYHAAQNYIAKLVQAGRRVAICEQTEDPAEAKGIVKREVVRVISPGVIVDEQLLPENEHCFLAAICRPGDAPEQWGVSFLDISTGSFYTGDFIDHGDAPDVVLDQLSRMAPAEILVDSKQHRHLEKLLDDAQLLLPNLCVTRRENAALAIEDARQILLDHFQVLNLDGFGCAAMKLGIVAAAALLDYVGDTQKTDLSHLKKLIPLETDSILLIDGASRRNLELTQTIIGNRRDGSLLAVLDRTCTPMGARLLRQFLLNPLQDKGRINRRLEAVSFFFYHPNLRKQLRDLLTSVYDIERLNSRMVLGHANGRDAIALKTSLACLPDLQDLLNKCEAPRMRDIAEHFDACQDLHDTLQTAIADDPPLTLRDGNLIKAGFHTELDELVSLLRDGKALILSLENKEREATGIGKLKVGYNKVFGYFIEISKANLDKVPPTYIRKQTLVNAERFITPELKEFENRVLSAQDRRLELEYQLFCAIREEIASHSARLTGVAHALALLDVFTCLAEIAGRYHYVKPEVTTDQRIVINEGRHPIIERALPTGKFVPNDIALDQTDNQLLIITGPNMAGKSTILRQTALIVLLAQMGSFVPAESATIGIVDRIFTRVGAMDDLRRGQSTFMVEMSETANILNNATPRSLVILDEIGRGTSTYDGLAIAWSVAEALLDKDGAGVKTLFATHYHELTDLARTRARAQNLSVAVKEWNDSIIFLHKLVTGGTSRSYGIQVAALAGVPAAVVDRAGQILKSIDRGDFDYQRNVPDSTTPPGKHSRHHRPSQLSLFDPPVHPVVEKLEKIDVDELSPRQALDLLYQLSEQLNRHRGSDKS
ncbi:DNA mismatch repair protein MutS [Desulfofustis glycolicus DSM 9705]|uniref:DNA mismatch repair protein MutS n=2 Tax=Desulfofustis glycolicus TaxID=51195 RepID=A0A1M5UZH8_9BACT|nr:DNA mismatch repair protein MutS [Desulfofustis glycolicus DSM 9705]